jgi:hypothetical protein
MLMIGIIAQLKIQVEHKEGPGQTHCKIRQINRESFELLKLLKDGEQIVFQHCTGLGESK